MTQQWTVPAWLVVVTAVVLALLVVVAAGAAVDRRRTLRRAAAETQVLHERLAALEGRLPADPPAPVREPREFMITRLGDELPADVTPAPAPVVPPALFADLVLREGVVQSAALLHGVRRALSPEGLHRVRFEMSREVKRSRKTRRAEQREAMRAWQAHRRADPAA